MKGFKTILTFLVVLSVIIPWQVFLEQLWGGEVV
jgi:regulatory protein YycH of two-component signal transduction system YycFG